MQYDLKHTRKNRVTDPDQRADHDDGNADDTRVGDELLLRGPRDLLHLCDDFPQEFDYFSHDRGRLLRLFVRRVLAAELAVLAELKTVRVVLLVLVRAIVAAMALRALQRNVVAHEYQLSSFVLWFHRKQLLPIYHTWKMLSMYVTAFSSKKHRSAPKKHKRTPEAGADFKMVAAQRFELRTLRV